MYALIIVLNKTNYLEDILTEFVRLGVRGATIIDTQGMASAIVHGQIEDIPLFGSLKTILEGSLPYNKTIFSVIDNEELLQKTVESVNEVLSDVSGPGVGFMFAVPVVKMFQLGNLRK